MGELLDLVQRHYEYVSTDIEQNREIFSADVETTDPGAGTMHSLDAFLEYGRVFLRAFPDGHFTIRSSLELGNRIAVEGTFSGTNTGPMVGPAGEIPPTGRRLDLQFSDFFEVENGKIVRHRIYYDQVDFMSQLGLLPAPEQVGA